MKKPRLVNIGALMPHPASGVCFGDIREPGGGVTKNVRLLAYDDELPPGFFEESAVCGVSEAAADRYAEKFMQEGGAAHEKLSQ